MAEIAGKVDLIFGIDNREALTGLERVKQSALNTGQEIQSAFQAFQGALAGTAVVATIKQLSDLAIASESANVRLTSLAGRFNESAQAVVIVANAARQLNLSQTEAAGSFAQLYSALRPTGVGLQDIETIFVGVTAAAKNSGLAAESVNNALIQLTQGLASGRLQGDELRSVLEQLPPLSQAIARELQVPVGSIKQLGSEGKITTDVIIRSLNSLKTIELAQLDKSLSTSAERIKALGVAWENLQLSLAQEFSGVGDSLLSGLKGALEFLSSINLTDTQQQIKTVEGQIAVTTKLITDSKKYKLDTTEAEERLRELEKRLQKLQSRPDVVTTDREQLYTQRLKILNDIQAQEKELFGQGATGVLFGTRDVSGRALLQGFDQAGAKAFTVLAEIQSRIDKLQSEKINLPLDATLQRQAIDQQLATLRSDLAKKRNGLIIDTQIEVSREALAELDRKLKQGSREPGLANERDQLRLQIEQLIEAKGDLQQAAGKAVPLARPEDTVNLKAQGDEAKRIRDLFADTTLFQKQTQLVLQASERRIALARQLASIEDEGQRAAVAGADAILQSVNEAKRQQLELQAQLVNQAAKGADTEAIASTVGKLAEASNNIELALINGGRALADQLKAAGDRLTDALTGNFNILNEQGRQIVLDQAQGNITRGIQTGLVDITKIPGRNDAASFIQFGQQSKAIADAFENNAVTQKAVAAAQAELAAGLKTATTGIQSSFNSLTESIPTLVAALNSNANADRSITVTVNADTGQTYIQQATALQ